MKSLFLSLFLFVSYSTKTRTDAFIVPSGVRNGNGFRARGLLSLSSVVEEGATTTMNSEEAKETILKAATDPGNRPDAETVFDAIRLLEKEARRARKDKVVDESEPDFKMLTTDGKWRLTLTTGDMKTQDKLGGKKINYLPSFLKAVQEFYPDKTITNGVYAGSFPLLKFTGDFTWDEAKSRLEFTFDRVIVLGLSLPYNQGESKVQPGFTFADIGEKYVVARGAGGGLALWVRVPEI